MEFNGEADHVHLLTALPPNLDLSGFVNNLKTTNSRLIHKEFAAKLRGGPRRDGGPGRQAALRAVGRQDPRALGPLDAALDRQGGGGAARGPLSRHRSRRRRSHRHGRPAADRRCTCPRTR